MPQDRYQTVQDVADRLDVAEANVRQWIMGKALATEDADKDEANFVIGIVIDGGCTAQ